MSLRLAVDFDGTLFLNYWPDIGPVIPYAVKYMRKLYAKGYELIIWSSRSSREASSDLERVGALCKMREALDAEGIPYSCIDYGDFGKIRANYYIDDHAIGVPTIFWKGRDVVDWRAVYRLIRLEELKEQLHYCSR